MRYNGLAQPNSRTLYLTGAEIRGAVSPRKRWNPWKLAGNLAEAIATVAVALVLGVVFVAWIL